MESKNHVLNRAGQREDVYLDRITSRIEKLCHGLNMNAIHPVQITIKVATGYYYPGITTVELDKLAAHAASTLTTVHPHYGIVAARIAISNLHKETKSKFSEVIDTLFSAVRKRTGEKIPMITKEHHKIIMDNADLLNSCIAHDKDFDFTYPGYLALERYLLKINGKIVERPQHMFMRVAIGIHGEDLESAIETYKLMSGGYFIHSTVTLSSAATPNATLSSSYALAMGDDSLIAIYKCITDSAHITKNGGEAGIFIQNIRAKGTRIRGSGGISNGVSPMIKVFDDTVLYVTQNGKNPGAVALYFEPWHLEIYEFLNLKKDTGNEDVRCQALSYALWIPDLFMKRVKDDEMWSLMCPHKCFGLHECWGDEFDKLYRKYESEGLYSKRIKARDLWKAICKAQIEDGLPHILYKDACNRKSNQNNLGTIKSSNLTTEIVQYSSSNETAACNMASLALNMFVQSDRKGFDFEQLRDITKVLVRNLDKMIDINAYPTPEAKRSNKKHRSIGIGVQGLADVFMLLRMPFESKQARLLNIQIFETIYYAALEGSCESAKKFGPYKSYKDSPVNRGILQYDMWGVTPTNLWDWDVLKSNIKKYGVRNSLLVALMPTYTTAEILGNCNSFEPYISNINSPRTSSGEYSFINEHLFNDLIDRGLWSDDVWKEILTKDGSIQTIAELPADMKEVYKTVWEISQKNIIDMATDRAAFIDQSQSMNIYLNNPTYGIMTSMHFYGWEKGLKTGMYYLKTRSSSNMKYDANTLPFIRLELDTKEEKNDREKTYTYE